ncbi:hypothetical protein [Nocardia terpenica]|uniref:hypothetical protein n=1 Tax=Nocardia terpenica TaxID=455432 RepID=UPI0018E0A574|nr:hypothetical protein [Nocardia terpenica]
MPWFKVDDGFANSRPVLRIPRRYRGTAIGLWTLAGTWCAKELTDGFVPDYLLEELGGTARVAALLVDAELWEPADGGWRFCGWEKYQPTRAQVLAERDKEADRKRRWRESRKNKGADSTASEPVSGESPAVASEECPGGTSASVPPPSPVESALPDPTRPDPVPKGTTPREPRTTGAAARGHRLPEGWQPGEDVIAAMRAECPHVDLRAEHTKFVDYWRSQPGAKARKADWDATWRNWIRRAAEIGSRATLPVPARPSRADEKVRNYLDIGARRRATAVPHPMKELA